MDLPDGQGFSLGAEPSHAQRLAQDVGRFLVEACACPDTRQTEVGQRIPLPLPDRVLVDLRRTLEIPPDLECLGI